MFFGKVARRNVSRKWTINALATKQIKNIIAQPKISQSRILKGLQIALNSVLKHLGENRRCVTLSA